MAIHFFDSLSEAREFDKTDPEGLDLSTFRIVSWALGGVESLKLEFRSRHHAESGPGLDKARPLPSGARRASNGRNIIYTGSKDGDGTNAVIYKQIDDGPREPLHLYTDFRYYHGSHNWGFRGGAAKQAGLALLADVIGEHDALPLLPFFVEEVVANFRPSGFYITAEAIEKWAEIVVRECAGELPPLRDGYS